MFVSNKTKLSCATDTRTLIYRYVGGVPVLPALMLLLHRIAKISACDKRTVVNAQCCVEYLMNTYFCVIMQTLMVRHYSDLRGVLECSLTSFSVSVCVFVEEYHLDLRIILSKAFVEILIFIL